MASTTIPPYRSEAHKKDLDKNVFFQSISEQELLLPLPVDEAAALPHLAKQTLFHRMIERERARTGKKPTRRRVRAAFHYSTKVIDTILELAKNRDYDWSTTELAFSTASRALPVLFPPMYAWLERTGIGPLSLICPSFIIYSVLHLVRHAIVYPFTPWRSLSRLASKAQIIITSRLQNPVSVTFRDGDEDLRLDYDPTEWDRFGASQIREAFRNPFMLPSRDRIDAKWDLTTPTLSSFVALSDLIEGCSIMLFVIYKAGFARKAEHARNGPLALSRRELLVEADIRDPVVLNPCAADFTPAA